MNSSILDQTVSIDLMTERGNEVLFDLSILSSSKVFEGHFPKNPILPGVIMLATIKKAISSVAPHKIRLSTVHSMKFLSVINPIETPKVTLSLKYKQLEKDYKIEAKIFQNTTTFFKIKALYNLI